MTEGEIAINYAEGYETISIKNSSGNISTFVSVWDRGTGANSAVIKGGNNVAIGSSSVAEGSGTTASGNYSHAEGLESSATSTASHAEGKQTIASGYSSHAEGSSTKANGNSSHAEGYGTTANSNYCHAEGINTLSDGLECHAEGLSTSAKSTASHAEGRNTYSYGDYSHAEGDGTKSNGSSSHAEGKNTMANRNSSHAEGYETFAATNYSHAEGSYTVASGQSSHAEGYYTETKNQSEHASGQYNVSSSASTTFGDSGNTLFSVGNGTSTSERHNAFEIRQNGDIYITKGGTDILLQDSLSGVVDQTIDSGTSASTNAVSTSAVYGFVTSYTPSITVDQVLDNTTSASTNPVSSKAVYDAVTDNELVWTMAYTTLSGAVSSHTVNENIHLIEGDRAKLNSIVSPFGTMAYEDKNSYSSSTEVNTALSNKSDINHTHEANNITAMTGYQIASSSASVLTTDTLLEVIGKLEKRIEMLESAMGGMTLMKVTQAEYDALTVKDQNTMYIIND